MTEQQYFYTYSTLNQVLVDQVRQGNVYVAYGIEKAIIKLQEDYRKQLDDEPKEVIEGC